MIIFVIFAFGLMMSFVVAKGMMQARDYAANEFKKQDSADQPKVNGE